MRAKNISLMGMTILTLMCFIVPVLACPPPGHSPGYWKHQFNATYFGKGKPHQTQANLEMWTMNINTYYGMTPPTYEGYTLTAVSDLDYDMDGDFDLDDTLGIFNDPKWNKMWNPLANWYNYKAGLAPYLN